MNAIIIRRALDFPFHKAQRLGHAVNAQSSDGRLRLPAADQDWRNVYVDLVNGPGIEKASQDLAAAFH
jgi:hypothetical protein